MATILFFAVILLFGIGFVGLYKNNDIRNPFTWIYNLCSFCAGLLIGFAVGNISSGALLGVLNVFVINYSVSLARWQFNLGGKLKTWSKDSSKKKNRIKKPKSTSPR